MTVPTAPGGPFAGIEVLELSVGIAGPMTGMLLADQGARVTRVERPGGDPFATEPSWWVWNRGKRSVALDLTDARDRAAFLALVDRADVLLESCSPGVTARLGIDPDTLLARNPALVYCSITAYGTDNEHADRPGYEALVAARTGRQWAQRGGILSPAQLDLPEMPIPDGAEQAARDEGPVFSASPWMSLNGFYHASLGIAAALVVQQRTGKGQHVAATMLNRAGTGSSTSLPGPPSWMTMKGAPKGLFECADGRWVHQWPLKPLTVLQAAEHASIDDAPPPDYAKRRSDPNRIGMEPEAIIELFHWFPLMQEAFRRFPAEDWARWGARVLEGVQIVRSPEEAIQDPALLVDGCVVEVDDPELGPIRHLGLLTDFSASPGRVQGPAPRPGADAPEPAPLRARADAPLPCHPLDGVVVLDLGLALAGPFASSVLSDLGADVVKVNAPWDQWWLDTAIGQMANRGKRSVCLDLQTPEGLAALHRMVARADIVTHNMRWGVAERLGVGYDDLRVHNPRVIYCQSRGFDRVRSAANLPGTDQMGSALGGQEWEDGGCGRGGRPFFGTSMGDLGNGYLLAIAAVQALYHRDRTGEGQAIGTSILNSCLATPMATFVRADGSVPERARLDALQLGFHARYRLYETADGWLCLAAVAPRHLDGLAAALGAALPADDAALAALLEARFRERTAGEWRSVLDAHGVPAEVSSPTFTRRDEDQPVLGFSRTPALVAGPAPRVGQHTAEILTQFGFTPDEIEPFLTFAGSRP
ncbi:MAG: CoA transferase [Acidimicrobiia bacterium]|jgi:crotonobetainyl-CoA:carnitine CoA-transferase CaiB-like acyl-CoA transferase